MKASRLASPDVDPAIGAAEEPEAADDEDEEQNSEAIGVDEAAFIARVTAIALRGSGLLQSAQYSQFSEEGFFVRSLVWTAIGEADGPRVELEAGFDNADDATGFSYAIRGVYGRKGDGSIKKTRAAPSPEERVHVLRLLEAAARTAMDEVVKLAGGEPTGSSGDAT